VRFAIFSYQSFRSDKCFNEFRQLH
jgi:hypothetical protein